MSEQLTKKEILRAKRIAKYRLNQLIKDSWRSMDDVEIETWMRYHNDTSMNQTTIIMKFANNLLDTHGVEAIFNNGNGGDKCLAEFCNTGDAYGRTLVYNNLTKRFIISSWGDMAEYFVKIGEIKEVEEE